MSRRKRKKCGDENHQKVGHETEEAANRVAQVIPHSSEQPLAAYQCSFCNKWHIGHKKMAIYRRTFLMSRFYCWLKQQITEPTTAGAYEWIPGMWLEGTD